MINGPPFQTVEACHFVGSPYGLHSVRQILVQIIMCVSVSPFSTYVDSVDNMSTYLSQPVLTTVIHHVHPRPLTLCFSSYMHHCTESSNPPTPEAYQNGIFSEYLHVFITFYYMP